MDLELRIFNNNIHIQLVFACYAAITDSDNHFPAIVIQTYTNNLSILIQLSYCYAQVVAIWNANIRSRNAII